MHMAAATQKLAAEYINADYDELTFQSSSTCSLEIVISGLVNTGFIKKDEIVLYSSQEHEGGTSSLMFHQSCGNLRTVMVDLPTIPLPTKSSIVSAFAKAIDNNPNVKLLLISHVSCNATILLKFE